MLRIIREEGVLSLAKILRNTTRLNQLKKITVAVENWTKGGMIVLIKAEKKEPIGSRMRLRYMNLLI